MEKLIFVWFWISPHFGFLPSQDKREGISKKLSVFIRLHTLAAFTLLHSILESITTDGTGSRLSKTHLIRIFLFMKNYGNLLKAFDIFPSISLGFFAFLLWLIHHGSIGSVNKQNTKNKAYFNVILKINYRYFDWFE